MTEPFGAAWRWLLQTAERFNAVLLFRPPIDDALDFARWDAER